MAKDGTFLMNCWYVAAWDHELIDEGFMEDKAIIEGQQRVLDADPDFKMHPIASDAALAQFRRVLERRIAAEQPGVRQVAA